MAGEQPIKKATLWDFIEQNSKLVTSLAAFVALTAFSSQLNSDFRMYLGAIALFIAMVLGAELIRQFPPSPRHWLLGLFAELLVLLIFILGYYWVKTFTVVWVPLAVLVVELILLLGFPLLVMHLLTEGIVFVAWRVFHHQIEAKSKIRIQQLSFFGSMAAFLICVFWFFHRGRVITIHTPSLISRWF